MSHRAKQVVMNSEYLIAEEPFHKNIKNASDEVTGAMSVVLWVSPDLPAAADAVKLLKDQASLLREMATYIEESMPTTPKEILH